jgi:hypothetical protein
VDPVVLIRDLGLPIALIIYFLWEAQRVAQKIETIHQDRLDREREYNESYRSLGARIIMVVDKNNIVNERVLQALELKEAEEETRVIKAFDPSDVSTPPVENREFTEEETTRHRQAKDLIKHRSPRPR